MRAFLCCFSAAAVIGIAFLESGAGASEEKKKGDKQSGAWTDDFSSEKADLVSTGRNPYFILEPGFQRVLEGGNERFVNTVFNETKMVDGVETRVIGEGDQERQSDRNLAELLCHQQADQ